MKKTSTLFQLYLAASRKHRKFYARFKKRVEEGSFYQQSPYKQRQAIKRVDKFSNQLNSLYLKLAMAGVTGFVTNGIAPSDVKAQGLGPFTSVNRLQNPLRAPLQIYSANIVGHALSDIDQDGDVDLFVGYYDGGGYVQLFKNYQVETGASKPIFTEVPNSIVPLGTSDATFVLSFVDMDGDGLEELAAAVGYYQPVEFWRNDNDGTGNFTSIGTSPTFGTLPVYIDADHETTNMVSVDIDNDGDLDIFTGTTFDNSGIYFWENDGLNNFTDVLHSLNGGLIDYATPAFFDIDNDGDQDMFMGDDTGVVHFFRNNDFEDNGIINDPDNFIQEDANPLNFLSGNFGSYTLPRFVDLDMDGDQDMVLSKITGAGPNNGYLHVFYNDGSNNFTEATGLDNPFGGVDVGRVADPAWTDINGDGDMDVFIGSEDTGIHYYENVAGTFISKTGAQNPLDLVGNPLYTSPSIADMDGDGDQDTYVGTIDDVLYFKNDGTASAPSFSPNSPNSLTSGSLATDHFEHFKLSLGNLDSDGDLDAIVGSAGTGYNMGADVFRFDNTNPFPGPPNFVFGDQNPFFYVNAYHRNAELVDIDHDGDLDIVTGGSYSSSNIEVFEYNPGWFGFKQMFPNPLSTLNLLQSAPSFMDYDNDGDLDLFIGTEYGTIDLFQNQNAPPVTTIVGGPVFFTEGDVLPVTLDPLLTVNDPDNNEFINKATVTIVEYVGVTDVLSWTDEPSLTESYSGGVLTISDTATVVEYQSILRSIAFENTGDNPGPTKTIIFEVWDNDNTDPVQVQQTINITEVNDPPSLTSTAGAIATEDIAYNYTATVTDLDDANDGVNLTWSLSGEPAGMTVSSTGIVTWTPLEGVLTSGAVTLTVQDGGEDGALPSSEVFTITVTPINDAPVITSTAGTSATENVIYTYTPVVFDPDDANDGTDLTWSLSGEPTGMTVDALGVVSWTPAVGVTTSGSVTLSVQDGGEDGSLPFSEVFVITVLPAAGNVLPVIAGSSADLAYRSLTGAIIVDDQISLSDLNDTDLVGATVTVASDYSPAEDVLTFIDQNGITGNFNSVTGTLTLTGTSSIANYETALRSITYENSVPLPSAASKAIEFIVSDDMEPGTPFTRTIVIASNQVIAAQIDEPVDVGSDITIDVIAGATFTLGDVITTSITSGPAFGTAVVNPDGSILFTPSNNAPDGTIDVISYELCNEFSSCGNNDINITILNAAPVINIPNTKIDPKGIAVVPLALGISDQNGNFDPTAITVLNVRSGLPVIIDTNLDLTIDYSGSNFTGADYVDLEICDLSGACSNVEVIIEVGPVTSVFVYNGITPNNDGTNDFTRILDIEFFPENELFIYNKIGIQVHTIKNYNNVDTVFTGIDQDGNELEDGTYYYVIVLIDPQGEKIRQSGYIVLQRN